MNFKTTIVLIVLLAVVALAVFFVQRQPAAPEQTSEQASAEKPLLPDLKQEDIAKVSITPADGPATVFEKRGSDWHVTQPVQGKADAFEVGDLVRELASLKTRTQVGGDVQTGVDKPRYTIELTTTGGQTQKLALGEKSGVGDFQYIKVNDNAKADVVPADIDRFLTKSAAEYRDMKLVDAPSTAINHVTLKRGTEQVVLAKQGADWQIVQPARVPVDTQQVQDLVSAITGLRAAEYVDAPQAPAAYQFNDPRLVVTYSDASVKPQATTAAASAPATQPGAKQIVFGRYEDVLKKNVFANVNGTVVKVAASALEQLNKSPLDLRDRKVLDVAADKVQRITVRRETIATTRPTTRPASSTETVIARANAAASTAGAATQPASATRPSTGPASAQAATAPTEPAAKWAFGGTATTRGQVDESKVDDLLSALHPLRTTKYLPAVPTTGPADRYVVTVDTQNPAGKHVVTVFAAPAGDGSAVAEYNGLVFEAPPALVDRLKGEFTQPSTGAGAPPRSAEIP
jgi:hypothetical protein